MKNIKKITLAASVLGMMFTGSALAGGECAAYSQQEYDKAYAACCAADAWHCNGANSGGSARAACQAAGNAASANEMKYCLNKKTAVPVVAAPAIKVAK